MSYENEFPGPNLGYVLELYERYQRDPDSVDEASRKLFDQWKPGSQTDCTLMADLQLLSQDWCVD